MMWAQVMTIAEHRGSLLPRHLHGVLRNRGTQDVVQPGNALQLLLRHGVREDYGVVLIPPIEG